LFYPPYSGGLWRDKPTKLDGKKKEMEEKKNNPRGYGEEGMLLGFRFRIGLLAYSSSE